MNESRDLTVATGTSRQASARAGAAGGDLYLELEVHRQELIGFSYRMLGSISEAEDAAQEALVRAWQSQDRFDRQQATPRTWLFSIARNICLDVLKSASRRHRAHELVPASAPGPDIGDPQPAAVWLEPAPDALVVTLSPNPEKALLQRESVRMGFLAALQHLPPGQRAVLILRDVFAFTAVETAQVLDKPVGAVTSALQRARSSVAALELDPSDLHEPQDARQRKLLDAFAVAFEAGDIPALVSLLSSDVRFSMPPFAWWLSGRDDVRTAWEAVDFCAGSRLVPTVANASPAFGQYRWDGSRFVPWALVTLEISGSSINSVTSHLHLAGRFSLWNLPPAPNTRS